MNLTKKISLAVLLTFSAVTVLSAHPAPRPRYRPAPVRISSPDFLIPGLFFGGLAIGTAIIAASAAESEANARQAAAMQAPVQQVPVYTPAQIYSQPTTPNVVVVSSPAQEQVASVSDPTANRNFVTKIAVLKADGKTIYYDSLYKRPVRYAGDIVYLSTINVDDVKLSYSAIQNVSYTPYR